MHSQYEIIRKQQAHCEAEIRKAAIRATIVSGQIAEFPGSVLASEVADLETLVSTIRANFALLAAHEQALDAA